MANNHNIDDLIKSMSSLDKSSFASNLERRRFLLEAQRMVTKLQTPLELTVNWCQVDPYIIATIKTLVALDFFHKWEQDPQPKTACQLAELTGAQASLLERLLRLMTVAGLLETQGQSSKGEHLYIFTDFAKATASGNLWQYWAWHGYVMSHAPTQLPAFLKKTKFHEPTDVANSPWFNDKGQQFMDWCLANPAAFASAGVVMAVKEQDSVHWHEAFPSVAAEIVQENNAESPVLVDIGGAIGADATRFANAFVGKLQPGLVVLQDLPEMVARAENLPAVVKIQAHEFFSEQPAKGAKAYYLHTVLHDWPDDKCLEILGRTKEAMKPGYSKLLINESVMSLESSLYSCASDICMMQINAARERTESEWLELLNKAGFSKVKLHSMKGFENNSLKQRYKKNPILFTGASEKGCLGRAAALQ